MCYSLLKFLVLKIDSRSQQQGRLITGSFHEKDGRLKLADKELK